MRILGIDYGEKRVGVAISDPLGIIASPLLVIEHKDDDSLVIEELLIIIETNNITRLVIGLPLNMNGSLGFQAQRICEFVDELKKYTQVAINFEDERESSKQVKEIMKTIKSKNNIIDDRAAAVILQNYLDYN